MNLAAIDAALDAAAFPRQADRADRAPARPAALDSAWPALVAPLLLTAPRGGPEARGWRPTATRLCPLLVPT